MKYLFNNYKGKEVIVLILFCLSAAAAAALTLSHSVALARLKFTSIAQQSFHSWPASASLVLGVQACASTPHPKNNDSGGMKSVPHLTGWKQNTGCIISEIQIRFCLNWTARKIQMGRRLLQMVCNPQKRPSCDSQGKPRPGSTNTARHHPTWPRLPGEPFPLTRPLPQLINSKFLKVNWQDLTNANSLILAVDCGHIKVHR